jgi:hypothetical protein
LKLHRLSERRDQFQTQQEKRNENGYPLFDECFNRDSDLALGWGSGERSSIGRQRRASRGGKKDLPRRLGLGAGRLYGQWPLAAGALRAP